LASRRRRRKTIGKVVSDVERRVRVVEKRPGAKRLKRNVVTAEKIKYRTVVAKNIVVDGVTPNEVSFGTTVVSGTDPDILKEGTTVVDPDTGGQKVYSTDLEDYILVTDPAAQATADSKNATYYQDAQPTGGTYEVGDMWIDTNDNDKLYTWDGTAWSLTQDSAAASAAAQTAYDAAIASLQPSASTIVNASNQITAVNTNGITVYSGASATTGARIVMNSAGIAGFDTTSTNASTGATFSISASTGDAVFKGSIQSGSTITGAAITGGTIKTADSGTRIELTTTDANRIYFYGSGTVPGVVSVDSHRIFVYAPGSTTNAGSRMSLYGDQAAGDLANQVALVGGTSGALSFRMSTTNISLDQGTYTLRMTATGVTIDGASAAGSYMLRNVRISTSSVTSGDASGTTDGNIYLVREA
jgi:hypothetical protein